MDLGPHVARKIADECEALGVVAQAMDRGLACDVGQTTAAARPALISALWRIVRAPIVVWTATVDAADRYAGDCECYLADAGAPVWTLRPRDDSPGASADPQDASARLETLGALADKRPGIYCISHAAFRQRVPGGDFFLSRSVHLRAGGEYGWEKLLRSFSDLGYERADVVSAVGEFAVRGGLIDIFPATADAPVRLEFFGDKLERVHAFAIADQRSKKKLDEVLVAPWGEEIGADAACVADYAQGALVVVDDPEMTGGIDRSLRAERDERTVAAADDPEGPAFADPTTGSDDAGAVELARPTTAPAPLTLQDIIAAVDRHPVVAFAPAVRTERLTRDADVTTAVACEPAPAYGRSIERFVHDVRHRFALGETIAVITVGHRRIREVLAENDVAVGDEPSSRLLVGEGVIDEGFILPALRLFVLCDAELFGHPARRHRLRPPKEGTVANQADLAAGDYLVHAYHGIGQYVGLEHLEIADVGRDFLVLKYAGSDRLYVPVDQMHYVRRYLASESAAPRLSKMGGSDWTRTRSKVREAVEGIAEGLIQLYAQRERAVGHAFAPDTPWQAELEEAFPYDETPDQRASIEAIKSDMEMARPMDRLVCGDVGYGKTEVAIRAAFKAVMDRKQVAVLAPTTVLAAQHYRTFTERFAAFPVSMGLLSRLRTKAEQSSSLRALADGSLDVIIGTHRLLQEDVAFARLGLVIVDEEQRFGVSHKEKLKHLRAMVDVLTLSATPIPRTLHMAMAGIRDLSLIQTAPEHRMAVKTVVTPTSDALIARAIAQELERGGQVYFVHNRIETIHGIATALARLAPRARIGVGHGKMHGTELENLMLAFVNGEFDVLVSTTIIENGLDIPNVNTIIVNNADKFGLAQLYQLRGRVGRSAHQAYAYLLFQPHRALTEPAQRRLEAIREFSHLGSGLRLAMRDLEIRGAGNLLGREQSGFIASVGFDEYCRILQEAIAEHRSAAAQTAHVAQTLDAEQTADVVGPPNGGPRTGLRRSDHPDALPQTSVDIQADAFLPDDYVESQNQKIAFYQRLAATATLEQVDSIADELRDRFGTPPQPALTLLEIARVRVVARAKGVEKLALEGRRLTLEVGRRFSLSEAAIAALTSFTKGNFRFTHSAIVAHLPASGGAGDGEALKAVREIVSAL